MKIYKRRLLRPHSQRNIYREIKEEITSKKQKQKQKTIRSQKEITWQRRTRDLYFFLNFTDFEQVCAD